MRIDGRGEMAGGGGIKASVNMRALFSDNDHDHNKVVAVKQRLDGGKPGRPTRTRGPPSGMGGRP